jgi:sigma-E factor negative regulatory protein RseA
MMNDQHEMKHEAISGFVDGQWSVGDTTHSPQGISIDADAMDTWHLYSLIGDVMRSNELSPDARELAFWQRLELKLEPQKSLVIAPEVTVTAASGPSANDGTVRWKWLAGVSFSALCAVLLAGFIQSLSGGNAQLAGPTVNAEMFASSKIPITDGEPLVMVRDPALDALMAAHRQLGGHSALQMPSGFLRNATFERPQR